MADPHLHPDDNLVLRDWLRDRRRPFGALVAILVVALPLILYLGRGQWFFLDEWDFLAARDGGNPDDLLRFHFDHPSVIPIAWYRIVWQFAGLRSYVPYQFFSVLAHLLSAGLLWLLIARRAHVRPWVALLAVVPYVFLGTGWQNIVWAFQIGLVGSMGFGFAQLYIASRPEEVDRKDLLGVAFGVAAIGCSGVGVTTTAIAGLAALMARGWKPALVHTLPVGATFLAWYVAYGPEDGNPTAAWSTKMIDLVRIAYQEVFEDLGWWTPSAIGLLLLLVVGVAAAWWRMPFRAWRITNAVPVAMALGGLGFISVTAWGRAVFFGTHFGASSRYTHILVASLVPLFAVAADALMQRQRAFVPLVVVVMLAGVLPNIREFEDRSREALFLAGPEELVHALAQEVAANPAYPDATQPLPERAQHVTVGWLRDVIQGDDIDLGRPVSARLLEEARFRLGLGVTTVPTDGDYGECEQLTEPSEITIEAGDVRSFALGNIGFELVTDDTTAAPRRLHITPFQNVMQLRPLETVTLSMSPIPHSGGPWMCR